MLLALDVGNTQTVAGLYEGRTLREHWRTATVRTHTCLLYTSPSPRD